jgi:hypothetical protein
MRGFEKTYWGCVPCSYVIPGDFPRRCGNPATDSGLCTVHNPDRKRTREARRTRATLDRWHETLAAAAAGCTALRDKEPRR